MRLNFDRALLGMVACAMTLGAAEAAAAQAASYPSKTIRIIVPFAPGGPNDLLARLVGQKFTELWGQPAVVENRGGAGGTVGTEVGVKSPPDGYTLLMGALSTLALGPSLYPKLPYQPLRDLAPITAMATVSYALVVNPHVPAKSIKELIALANSKRASLTFGSSGVGSTSHLAAEYFKTSARIELLHVAYKGIALAMSDVIAGYIDMQFNDLRVVLPHDKAGKLRMLAVTNGTRSPIAPQLPTVAEAGVKDYAVDPWYGIVAPAGTPKDIIAKLNSTIVNILKSPEVKQQFDQLGYLAIGNTPEQFTEMIRTETERYAVVIKRAGIKREL